MNVPRLIAGMITMLSVLATAACSVGAPTDRAGGETVTLKLATIDHVNPDGQSFGVQAFVDNIPQVSDGRLNVEIVEDTAAAPPPLTPI